jgi:hypothetical protein
MAHADGKNWLIRLQDDIDYKSDSIIVTVPKTKNNVPRMFAITNKQWIEIIKKYANLPVRRMLLTDDFS